MSERVAKSVSEATIHAPAAAINLTDWVFTLTDTEYQACSKNHIAAATSKTAEGKRMSLNVEQVGNLMVQHYVEDISERAHCRLVSTSDSIGPEITSHTKVAVIWEFTTEPIDANTTKFTNSVEVRAVPEYLGVLEKRGVPLSKASELVQTAVHAHNEEETPVVPRPFDRLVGREIGRQGAVTRERRLQADANSASRRGSFRGCRYSA